MQGEPVILLRASVSGQDAYGNDVTTFTPETIYGSAWVPGSEAEITEGTKQVTADAECYLPAGTVIGPLDQVTRVASGETFHVIGESSSWTSPWTSVASPVQVRLRRITGGSSHALSGDGG